MAKGIKTGGRELGTPNKITADLRERISDFLNDNWEQIEMDFQQLEVEKRVLLFEKLLQFTLPKLQSIQIPSMKGNFTPPVIVFEDFQKTNTPISLTQEQIDKYIDKL